MDTYEWFDKLYRENTEKMLRISMSILGNRETAEDVVQATFVILLQKQKSVKLHENPAGWLFIALKHQINNALRREVYRQTVPMDEILDFFIYNIHDIPLAGSLPKGLSSSERDILLLYYEDELSHEQLAERLGCSAEACRARLFRARNKLKKLYEEID